jgi:hypothetical protein
MTKFIKLSDLVKGQATEIKDYTRKSKKSLANKLLFFKVRWRGWFNSNNDVFSIVKKS